MKTKIFIGTLIIIVITYIGLTEMDMRPKLNLIKDAETINANIKKAKMPKTTEQILIKNGYKLNDTDYKIKGEGVIFLEEQYSFFIERKGMCAMKLPYSDKVMFQKAKCPEYRLINGLKMPILTSGQGVHEKDGVYTFKGNSVGNYVRYEHDFYRILSINKDMITLVKTEKENIEFETVEELYRKINDKYSIPNTIETEYNIDAVELSKNTINIINKKNWI